MLFGLLAAFSAYAQTDVWRYDTSTGRWFKFDENESVFKQPSTSTIKVQNNDDITGRYTKNGADKRYNVHSKPSRSGNSKEYFIDSKKYKIIKNRYLPLEYDTLANGYPYLHLTVKSNAVYAAALALNGGLELSFGKKWSVGADGYITWLQWTRHNNWYETYGFDVYGRYWFGKENIEPLTGYHIGLYAGTLTYDWFPEGKGYQSKDMFHTFRIGVEFGYSQYLTKRNRNWRVDFYGGLGFFHTRQDVYHNNFGGGYYSSERRYRNLPDFSRLGITIGYMFGQKKK